jgi:SpoVK/Ycf46/Vps4 family AAA+-type ATPase
LIEHEKKSSEEQGLGGPHINLDETGIDELVSITKGYSGADLKALSAEAAMIPLRSIEDIENVDASNIRALTIEDFRTALENVKATVN